MLCGPALARRAPSAGVVYSLAYGDQPALIAELVDWARAVRLRRSSPRARAPSTCRPTTGRRRTTVWEHYGLTPERGRGRRHEPPDVQLLPRRHQVGDRDGGGRQRLRPRPCPQDGLALPALRRRRPAARAAPARRRRHARARRAWSRSSPRSSATAGRCSATCAGASTWCSRRRTTTRRRCFAEYGLRDRRDRPLRRACTSPFHLIGLELGDLVLGAALRGEPTGAPTRLARRRRRRGQARPRAPASCSTARAATRLRPARAGRARVHGAGAADRPRPRVRLRRAGTAGCPAHADDVELDPGHRGHAPARRAPPGGLTSR